VKWEENGAAQEDGLPTAEITRLSDCRSQERSSEVCEHVGVEGGDRWIPGRRKMGKKIEGKTMEVIREGDV
jgi:hypothetical protein